MLTELATLYSTILVVLELSETVEDNVVATCPSHTCK